MVRDRLTELLTGNAPGDVAALVNRVVASIEPDQLVELSGGWAWLVEHAAGEGAARVMSSGAVDPVSLRAAARARGWATLVFSSYRGDETTAALVAALEPQLVATKMSLDVSAVEATGDIELWPMTQQQYDHYATGEIEHYAEELFGAGGFASMDEARQESRQQHDHLLPDGLATPNHHLWAAYAGGGDAVGTLWIADEEGYSFIYAIEVDPAHQGRGHGTAMLRAGASTVRDSGRTMLWLNVFGHNPNARRLYEREGYAVNEQMWRVATAPGMHA
ncbi:hypothetical protein GCM10027579_24980 [Calidifontibacter terrae]